MTRVQRTVAIGLTLIGLVFLSAAVGLGCGLPARLWAAGRPPGVTAGGRHVAEDTNDDRSFGGADLIGPDGESIIDGAPELLTGEARLAATVALAALGALFFAFGIFLNVKTVLLTKTHP